jgi:heme exporter protein D
MEKEVIALAPFIVAAYAVTGAAIGALVGHAFFAERKQQRALAALEAQGIRRRSDAAKKKSDS